MCLSPWTDLALQGESQKTRASVDPFISEALCASNVRHYIGIAGNPYNPLASPLYADLRGLPPLLVLVGTAEVLMDDSIRLVEKARQAQVEVDLIIGEQMIHVWPFSSDEFPEAREAVVQIANYIRKILK
ncbi:alpha/beta hydrolase [Paraburkholderia phymatum]|uniref:alpha/beta hydrolase n=1 Tax=Paraburkholderia phymatum TaxID=148447 RepID=UPI001FC8F629|nr:alpha/beta hydrolase [Paraburkholderia phymatum]